MSSPDDRTPYSDNPDDQPQPAEDQQAWPATKYKKASKKKVKKTKKNVGTWHEPDEEAEDPPFARAITLPYDALPEQDAGVEERDTFGPAVAPSPTYPQLPAPTEFYGVNLDDEDYPPDHAVLDDSSLQPSPTLQAVQDDAPTPLDNDPAPKPVPLGPTAARSPPRAQTSRTNTNVSSPPARQTLPYGSPPPYTTARNHRKSTSGRQSRPAREPFASQTSAQTHFVEPAAPPHKAQPHFHGPPELDLNLKKNQSSGKAAGADDYCCCFDSFADAGDDASAKKAKDALLVGSEGGLEVFRVLPNKLEVVGRLEGLRGSVIGAKILPHTELHDQLRSIRPLVAIVVHGVMPQDDTGIIVQHEQQYYQTTNEVYSLQTQSHVATLYKSQPVAVQEPTIGHLSSLPGPIGDLQVTAQGRFVVVSSGKSGELFVFTNAARSSSSDGQFRCIGKFWTSLRSALDHPSSRPQSSNDGQQSSDEGVSQPGVPLLSLSHRWLALVPPSTSSHVSIQGTPTLSDHNPNPPGLASAVSPPPPPLTCDISGVDAEDTWSRLTRQAAKGVVKYSQKGIDLGWQGWRELTNPTPVQSHERPPSRDREDLFPPTNAPLEDPKRSHREPGIISIIDLAALSNAEELKPKYPPPPLATFALDEGCNFLSFSSNGLRLLTSSRKGDTSTIWDLSRSCHGIAKELNHVHGPVVKLVHRMTRNSPSIVVDCAWTRDDKHVALLTLHGTIHMHEVPTRSTTPRKRKRRSTATTAVPEKAEPIVSVSHGTSPPSSNGGFFGSIKSGWQQMSSQVTSLRSQNAVSGFGIPTSFAGIKDATASAGHASGRVLAKGLSQGLSAAKGGASDYLHADDNKIRHKLLQGQATPGALRWIKRQSDLFLAVVSGGIVHLHPVERVERRKGDETISGLKHDKYGKKHFPLPPIRTRESGGPSNATTSAKKARDNDNCAMQGPHGFWSLRMAPGTTDLARVSREPPRSQINEVETNPPYCPFHVDRHVDIYTFDLDHPDGRFDFGDFTDERANSFNMHGHGGNVDNSAWVFGEPLPDSTKMNTHEELDGFHQDALADSDINIDLSEQMESTLTVHTAVHEDGTDSIQINTRRAQVRTSGESRDFDVLEDEDDEL